MSATTVKPLAGPRGRLVPTMRLLRDPLSYYRSLFAEYGDPVLIRALNGDILLTASQEGAQQILTARPEIYDPFATEALGALVGRHSLLTLRGTEHRRQRKLVMPSFHGQRMREYAQTMADATERSFQGQNAGDVFVAMSQFHDLTLEVIIRTVFGVQNDDQVVEVARAVSNTTAALKPIFLFSSQFQIAPLGLGPWATFRRRAARLDELLYARIAAAREDGEGTDILSMLLAARDENDESMTDEELRDQLVTLLVAGHETTAVALSWALYHLHQNSDSLAALQDELRENADNPLEEVPRLPYMRATVQETLRLFPIIPDFLRTLNAPMELMGRTVEAGKTVAIATTVMHHDPEIYPDPMRFDPSRWVTENPPKWAYFPFGGGHRRCVGAAFAEFEIGIVLATLLRTLELELVDRATLYPERRNVTLSPPGGVKMRVTARS